MVLYGLFFIHTLDNRMLHTQHKLACGHAQNSTLR